MNNKTKMKKKKRIIWHATELGKKDKVTKSFSDLLQKRKLIAQHGKPSLQGLIE
jgi:hypothetical protein